MTTTRTRKVTRRDAERALAALKRQHGWLKYETNEAYHPQLVEDFHWDSTGHHDWAIVWEGGPYDWTMWFPYGGYDPEVGHTIKTVEMDIPDGVFAEPITTWALGLYPTN